VPLPQDSFTRAAFERRRRIEYDAVGHAAAFIAAEDLVVAKLIAFRETGSDKHLRDARGVLVMQWDRLELESIRRSARAWGVLERFEEIMTLARRELEG
jgi:hypothetical protein